MGTSLVRMGMHSARLGLRRNFNTALSKIQVAITVNIKIIHRICILFFNFFFKTIRPYLGLYIVLNVKN